MSTATKGVTTSGAGISRVSVELDLTMTSETPPSSAENSVSSSRFSPPYLTGTASAGTYLEKAAAMLVLFSSKEM